MKKIVFIPFVFLVTLTFLISCKKYEGEGGRGSINGKIYIMEILHLNSNPSDTIYYDGADEDVFIIYGDGKTTPDDKIECGYDGSFSFKYLQPGTYTIYAYSEIFNKGTSISNNDDDYYEKVVVKQMIELGKKEDLDLGTITLIR